MVGSVTLTRGMVYKGMSSPEEHPSKEGFEPKPPIRALNCQCCSQEHQLGEIEPSVVRYSEEPAFNHFEYYCDDNSAVMFGVPEGKLDELVRSGVLLIETERPSEEIVRRYQTTMQIGYHAATERDKDDVAEFRDKLKGMDDLEAIRERYGWK